MTKTVTQDMNDEELARHITKLLEDSMIVDYRFEIIKTKDEHIITKFSMKTNSGWEVENKDVWSN